MVYNRPFVKIVVLSRKVSLSKIRVGTLFTFSCSFNYSYKFKMTHFQSKYMNRLHFQYTPHAFFTHFFTFCFWSIFLKMKVYGINFMRHNLCLFWIFCHFLNTFFSPILTKYSYAKQRDTASSTVIKKATFIFNCTKKSFCIIYQ